MAFVFYENRRDATRTIYEYRRMRSKPPATVFGQRLREARERIGMPQDKLGIRIGLDEGSASARISRYELGVHEPPFELARKLAKVLGVPPALLYCPEDDLAEVIRAWPGFSKAEKKRILALTEDGEG